MASVLLTHWLLVNLVSPGASEDAHSLVSLLGPPATILPFSVLLIFVPAALAFLAIGVPFALRTAVALARGTLEPGQILGLAGLAGCVAAALVEINQGGKGVVSLAALALVSGVQGRAVLRGGAESVGWRLLATAGLLLLGLAYYEYRYISLAQLSIAVAPTLLLFGFFFASSALVITTAAPYSRGGGSRLAKLLAWMTAVVWYAAPSLRSLVNSIEAADQLEFFVAVSSAVALLALGLSHARAN